MTTLNISNIKKNKKNKKDIQKDNVDFYNSISYGGIIKCKTTEKYLLVQGPTGKWSFPKGHKELNETPFECAEREIYEETGLLIKNIHLQQIIRASLYFYFLIEIDEELKTKEEDKIEIINIQWYSLEEIEKIIKNQDVNAYFNYLSKKNNNNNNQKKNNYN
jgi:8-oxo-dGTP pyrophosphatase MutT (NUDIX family)